jgi:hypothetical protein
VLDRGDPTVNQRVNFVRAEIKENNDTFTSQGQLLVVDHYEPTCDLELDGRTMRVTSQNFVQEIPNAEIDNKSCEYRSQQKLSFFEPGPGQTTFQVEMCINGRCFPDAGSLILLNE